MLVKFIISTIIFFSAGAVGYLISLRYSLRVKDISCFLSAMNYLETEILYYSNSLPLSIEKIGNRINETVGNFFIETYELLNSKEGYRIEEAWTSAVINNAHKTSLKKEDIQIITDFGKELGIGDKEVQRNHFKYIKVLLEEQRNKALEEKEVNGKMYNKLGFILGLVIVIILI